MIDQLGIIRIFCLFIGNALLRCCRAIQTEGGGAQVHHGMYHTHTNLATPYLYSHYIVWLCLLAVSLCIALYALRLRRFVKPRVGRPGYWPHHAATEDEESLITRKADNNEIHSQRKMMWMKCTQFYYYWRSIFVSFLRSKLTFCSRTPRSTWADCDSRNHHLDKFFREKILYIFSTKRNKIKSFNILDTFVSKYLFSLIYL